MRLSPQRTEVAKLRVASKIPQKQMAHALGVSVGHFRFVELGLRESKSLTERAMKALRGG